MSSVRTLPRSPAEVQCDGWTAPHPGAMDTHEPSAAPFSPVPRQVMERPSSEEVGLSDAVHIHESAFVDDGAQIGARTRVWHFCYVMSGARIGCDCVLGQNVFVASGVQLGDGCRVQNNVSIYEGVELAPRVFVGPSVVFTNVRTPRAHIRRNTAAHFAPTRVGEGATLGANA